jgi:hypothetical protein
MSTQWHPVFAHLLKLALGDYYDVQTEVPVSELPRRGDILLIRRQERGVPPFQGLWSHLSDWNVVEFKGVGDDPEEDDLELLVHVGAGLTLRLNEERRTRQQERLAARQVAFWYLAPKLGETFLGRTRLRTFLDYQTGGLWRGTVWGHPAWFVSYRDVPVEEDTIPLRLLDRDPGAPAALGELVLGHQELLRRFAPWLGALQPRLWQEMRHMAGKFSGIIDWEAVGKNTNLDEVVRVLPPERVIEILGLDRVIEVSGAEKVLNELLARIPLDELLARIPAEQLQEMLRRRQEKG